MESESIIIEHLINTTKAIKNTYTCCDDFIAIGGIALHCHMSSVGLTPIIGTHDADVICGHVSYPYIRDEFSLAYNGRMNKHEYKTTLQFPQGGQSVDVDIYVIYMNGLDVNVEEVIEHAVIINDLKCAHLVHLLVLKIDNYIKFDGNKESDKFKKVIHDILQIIGLLATDEETRSLISRNFNETRLASLCGIVNSHKGICNIVCNLFRTPCFSEQVTYIRDCA